VAVTYTQKLGLPQWGAPTDPFNRAQINAAMQILENFIARSESGATLAARPAAAIAGRYWTDQSTNASYRDTGSAWVAVGAFIPGTSQVKAATGQVTTPGTPIFKVTDHTYGDTFAVYGRRAAVSAIAGIPTALDNDDETFTAWAKGDGARVGLGAVSYPGIASYAHPAITFRGRPSASPLNDDTDTNEALRLVENFSGLDIQSPNVEDPTFGSEDWRTTAKFGPAYWKAGPTLELLSTDGQTGPLLAGPANGTGRKIAVETNGRIRTAGGVAVGTAVQDDAAAPLARIDPDGRIWAAGTPNAEDVGAAITGLRAARPYLPVGIGDMVTASSGWSYLGGERKVVALPSAGGCSLVSLRAEFSRTAAGTITAGNVTGNITDMTIGVLPASLRPAISYVVTIQVVAKTGGTGRIDPNGNIVWMEYSSSATLEQGDEIRISATYLTAGA
jgi:hypothetical protein